MTTKRLQIVNEMSRRLTMGLKEPLFRGFAHIPVKVFPSIYIFEDEEKVELIKPGLYRKWLPLVVERFSKVPSNVESYVYGNRRLQEMVAAIELDERLCAGFNSGDIVDATHELVINYSMTSNVIVEMSNGILDVVVTYVMDYVSPFLGYQAARH